MPSATSQQELESMQDVQVNFATIAKGNIENTTENMNTANETTNISVISTGNASEGEKESIVVPKVEKDVKSDDKLKARNKKISSSIGIKNKVQPLECGEKLKKKKASSRVTSSPVVPVQSKEDTIGPLRSKNADTVDGKETSSEESMNTKRDLLDRRPLAPDHLNLSAKKSKDTSPQKGHLPRVSTQSSPTQPLISPKIIELRRSESFNNNKSSNEAEDSAALSLPSSPVTNIQRKPSKKLNRTEDNVASSSSTAVNLQRKSSKSGRKSNNGAGDTVSSLSSSKTTNLQRKPSKNINSHILPGAAIPSQKSRRWALARGVMKSASAFGALPKGDEVDKELLARLEQENSQLPPQNFSAEFLLARLEKQNEMLDSDPKSVCIQSNVLKANLETVQSLVEDITSPTSDMFDADSLNIEDDDASIDWEFWTALIQDYTGVAARLPHLLSARLQQGLPSKLRGLIWQSMCQASSTYLETMYSQLLEESSPYDRIIQRDLARTFPHIEMFKEEGGQGQTMLWNVLRAYSLYDPLVGYCQGLGFLVGPLLMNMSEAQAFSVFVRLMETYDMRTMFTLNMEGLQLRLYQFSALLMQILPKLHSHFQLHSVHAAMFASQWFLSLFAYTYPLPLVLRIYDVVFAEGAPETIMRVAIALLQKNESKLLELGEFEDLLDFLTARLYEAYDNKPTGLIKDAMALSSVITKAKLDELSGSYVKELEEQKKRTEELAAVRFNGRFGRPKKEKKKESKKTHDKSGKPKRWSLAAFPSSAFQSAINTSSDISAHSSDSEVTPPIPSPPLSATGTSTAMLHQQIEDLVTALSDLQKEHADITEQLVNIKMEKMDLVNEVEQLRSRVREMEKEKKRASVASSMFSVDSAIASNDDGLTSSRRASVTSGSSSSIIVHEDSDITPRQSVEQHKTRRVSSSSLVSISRLFTASSPTSSVINTPPPASSSDSSEFDFVNIADECKVESAITEELIQVKKEKFEFMQENDNLQKRLEELESSLQDSQVAQGVLQEKNTFLRQEIGRLDEEAAHAVYEQNSMERDVVKLKNENENLKNQVEALQEKVKILQEICVSESNPTNASVDTVNKAEEKASKRVSFLNLFGGVTNSAPASPRPTLLRTSSEQSNSSVHIENDSTISEREHRFVCKGGCEEMVERTEKLEQALADYKLRLAESEEARESMGSQLDGLRMLINGFAEDGGQMLPMNNDHSSSPGRQHEKRGSMGSLVAFFSSGV